MRDFFEDYGEFIALFVMIVPIITTFVELGIQIGKMNFGG